MLSLLIWSMVGIALWHFAVLVPDRFWGGIIGAFLAALLGAVATGYLLPAPGFPSANPPGVSEALCAIPGSLLALVAAYRYGSRQERGARQRSSDCRSPTPDAAFRPGRARATRTDDRVPMLAVTGAMPGPDAAGIEQIKGPRERETLAAPGLVFVRLYIGVEFPINELAGGGARVGG